MMFHNVNLLTLFLAARLPGAQSTGLTGLVSKCCQALTNLVSKTTPPSDQDPPDADNRSSRDEIDGHQIIEEPSKTMCQSFQSTESETDWTVEKWLFEWTGSDNGRANSTQNEFSENAGSQTASTADGESLTSESLSRSSTMSSSSYSSSLSKSGTYLPHSIWIANDVGGLCSHNDLGAIRTDKHKEGWRRAENLKVSLEPKEISYNQVWQTMTGNCYLMSTLAGIAKQQPGILQNIIKEHIPTTNGKENPDGIRQWKINLYKNGVPGSVIVDNYFPDVKYLAIKDTDAHWSFLIEKAYAYFHSENPEDSKYLRYKRCYDKTAGGHSAAVLRELTNVPAAVLGKAHIQTWRRSLLGTLNHHLQEGNVLTCAIQLNKDDARSLHSFTIVNSDPKECYVDLYEPHNYKDYETYEDSSYYTGIKGKGLKLVRDEETDAILFRFSHNRFVKAVHSIEIGLFNMSDTKTFRLTESRTILNLGNKNDRKYCSEVYIQIQQPSQRHHQKDHDDDSYRKKYTNLKEVFLCTDDPPSRKPVNIYLPGNQIQTMHVSLRPNRNYWLELNVEGDPPKDYKCIVSCDNSEVEISRSKMQKMDSPDRLSREHVRAAASGHGNGEVSDATSESVSESSWDSESRTV